MKDIGLQNWLESLAAKQPTPGGGAAAGLAAATAAALVGMVSNYTTGEKWADRAVRMQAIADEAEDLRLKALALMAEDEQAFASVGAAYGLPKETEGEQAARKMTIETAIEGAAQPPLQTAEVAAKVLALAEELVDVSNPNVLSDVAVAASFARAALEAAIVNIEINDNALSEHAAKEHLQKAVQDAEAQLAKADQVVTAVRTRMNQK